MGRDDDSDGLGLEGQIKIAASEFQEFASYRNKPVCVSFFSYGLWKVAMRQGILTDVRGHYLVLDGCVYVQWKDFADPRESPIRDWAAQDRRAQIYEHGALLTMVAFDGNRPGLAYANKKNIESYARKTQINRSYVDRE